MVTAGQRVTVNHLFIYLFWNILVCSHNSLGSWMHSVEILVHTETATLHIHAVNLPFYYIPKKLYSVQIW